MLRSLSAAISGMRNHQTKLDVVGNNIANVNTVSYKYEAARFQDSFSQTLKGASASLQGRGGTNPIQVGLGMELSSINTVHTQGAITGTGRETDLAIEGRGFFVVSDGRQDYYTRDGTFVRDASGILTNANGLRLLGWALEEGKNIEELDTLKRPTEIMIPVGEKMAAKPTNNIVFAGNLDARIGEEDVGTGSDEEQGFVCRTSIFDSLGNEHILRFTFIRDSENVWRFEVGREITEEDGTLSLQELELDGEQIIYFTTFGNYKPFDENDEEYTYVLTIDSGDLENGADDLAIELDFSSLTQLASSSSAFVRLQDGYYPGDLATFNIDELGVITATYTNGYECPIAQLALADFSNPEGLLKMGSNLYDSTFNSGDPRLGTPGFMGRGLIRAKSLEMSNVDLANEFTEMITTSRAFQANSRVISTSDEILLELVNLKR